MSYELIHGDCFDVIGSLPSASFDAIITDPPYPCIRREYGTWTEGEWLGKMKRLVPELRRVLKPSGSCVMVLQPNSERVGKMRTWLWHFMAWVGDEWGIVQDAYWWNTTAAPTVHTYRTRGLMRPSIKPCVWIGDADCYRNQDGILWTIANASHSKNVEDRALQRRPSGQSIRSGRMLATAIERGGSTPFNLIPMANADSQSSAGSEGHGAGTPLELCRWWTRYICPPGGAILDPFAGSGTTGIAALEHGASYVGIERYAKYIPIAEARLAEAVAKNATPQTRLAV